jgi:hypothetical protein
VSGISSKFRSLRHHENDEKTEEAQMANYRTIKPKNPHQQKTATDVHITTYDPDAPKPANPPKLNVKGIDGKAPGDPNASYQLDGDGTDSVDISDINVGTGGEVNIRLQNDSEAKFPKIWVYWTDQSGRIAGGAHIFATARPSHETGNQALAALDEIVNLATSVKDTFIPRG